MSGDARGWRIALVPDALVNPPAGHEAVRRALRIVHDRGYGLLQLPTPDTGVDAGLLLAVIADQVAEYAHHGYAVVAVGLRGEPGDGLHWRRLAALLRRRGVAALPRHVFDPGGEAAAQDARLADFLERHDIAEEEQRIWRT